MNFPELATIVYCERTDDSFWAEPLNAVTNFAFILVAIHLFRYLQDQRTPSTGIFDIWLLIILAGFIGIGSFLWHTFTTSWAQWLDVIPILLYMSVFLVSFLHRIIHRSLSISIAWLMVFYAVNLGVYQLLPTDIMNGSLYYFPSLLILIFITRYERKLRAAAILFLVGLIFRSIDQVICPWLPIGTHFLWHISISLVVLYTAKPLFNIAVHRRGTI